VSVSWAKREGFEQIGQGLVVPMRSPSPSNRRAEPLARSMASALS